MKWYLILLGLIVALALLLPPNPSSLQTLHISTLQYKEVILTLIVPYAVIWFAAFYAYDILSQYTARLGKSKENVAFRQVTSGFRVIAWGLMLTTLLSLVLTTISNMHPGFTPTRVIIINYVTLLVPLVGFVLISGGTHTLTELVNARATFIGVRMLFILLTIVSVLFTYTVLHIRFTSNNPYHLPVYPLLLTIVVPYVFTWFNGLLAAFNLGSYARNIKGVLYRQALGALGNGITIVVLSSIIVQYVTVTLGSNQNITLGFILLVLYILLALQVVGYGLVALGAKRLKRIEEV